MTKQKFGFTVQEALKPEQGFIAWEFQGYLSEVNEDFEVSGELNDNWDIF